MAGGSRQYVFIVRKYKNMRNLKLFMTNTISYNQHNGHYNKLFYITSHTGGFLGIKTQTFGENCFQQDMIRSQQRLVLYDLGRHYDRR